MADATITAYQHINEELCRSLGLSRFYPFHVEECGPNRAGYFVAAAHCVAGERVHDEPRIVIDSGLGEETATAVYLHELAHLLAYEAGHHRLPDSETHTPIFAVILAVMYRRFDAANGLGQRKMMGHLWLYDFCDDEFGTAGPLSDDEIIARFVYVVDRSAELASSRDSIESICRHLGADWRCLVERPLLQHEEDIQADKQRRFIAGAIAGAVAGAAALAVALKFWPW